MRRLTQLTVMLLGTLSWPGWTQEAATVPAKRVYVTTADSDTASRDELVRCTKSLKQALTPSLGTLLHTEDRASADVIVELDDCSLDESAQTYEIVWTLSFGGSSEELRARRALTPSRPPEWQMRATTRELAKEVLRRTEAKATR